MLLKNRMNKRTAFRAAMACILVSSALPLMARFAGPTTDFWIGVMDGIRGAALGAAIALIAVSGVLRRRNRDDAEAC
jgi:hypothetical protein